MKKNKLMIMVLAFILSVMCISTLNKSNNVLAENTFKEINYVSLGDSIAAGNELDDYVSGVSDANISATTFNAGVFVNDSYSSKMKLFLENKFGADNVSSVTLATSNDNTTNLLEKLENIEVQTHIKHANIVTICIGANDILLPALSMLKDYIMGSTTMAEIEDKLDEGLSVFEGTDNNDGNLTKIINKLYDLNSSAKFIFTTIYNPYKYLAIPEAYKLMASSFGINDEKVGLISSSTECYLAGGTNSQGEQVKGLNQILKEILQNEKESGKTNLYLADSKEEFDKYNLESAPSYKELVNVKLTKDATNLSIDISNIYGSLMGLADPHPTALGHEKMFNVFKDVFNNNFVKLTLDYNGGVLDKKSNKIMLVDKYSLLNEPAIPEFTNAVLDGWYISLNSSNAWDFKNDRISTDITLYAKWITDYVVTFNSNGGSAVSSENIPVNGKVNKPQTPIKLGDENIFVGWYYNNELWDFENRTVNSNITLVAKWVGLVCENTNRLEQIIDNVQNVRFKIEIEDVPINWYVNNALQNETENIFNFTPENIEGEYEVYCVVNNTQSKKYQIIVNPATVIVSFNSNGGSFVNSIDVEKNQKVTKPISPTKTGNENIFAGWYYGDKLWDFENDVATVNMTLKAKWVGLICSNENSLNQIINNLQHINFSINISNATINWYVNDTLQAGQTMNMFSFKPNQAKGTYQVYCVVNGVETRHFVVTVNYETPDTLEIDLIKVTGSLYQFKVKDAEYYNTSKIVWYKTKDVYSSELEQVGVGGTCEIKLSADCYVCAIYDGEIIASKYEVIIERQFGNEILIIGGAVGGALLLGILIFIISKRRFNKYY